MVVVLLVFAMLFHSIYYKMRWIDEAETNKRNMNKVGCKMQDLELKISILTYKMQYGTWPLPHQIRSPDTKELQRLKCTLSNTSGKKLWNGLGCERNTACLTFSQHRLRSMQHLTKLIDLETKYISSQFENDVSSFESTLEHFQLARSSRTNSERSSGRTSRTIRSIRKGHSKRKPLSKSEHLEIPRQSFLTQFARDTSSHLGALQAGTQLQVVRSHTSSTKPYERLIKTSKECRKYIEEIKASNKSLGLVNSSTEVSNQNSSKDVGVGTQPEQQNCFVDSKAWYECYKREEEGARESHENDLNVSNQVIAVTRQRSDTSRYSPSTDMLFSNSDNPPKMKKSRTLPPGLSITFLTDKYQNFPPRDKRVTTALHQKQQRTTNSTSETLCRVKEKLESLHDVKNNCRNTRKSSPDAIEVEYNMDMIFQNAFNFDRSCGEKSTASCGTAVENNCRNDGETKISKYEQREGSFSWTPVQRHRDGYIAKNGSNQNDPNFGADPSGLGFNGEFVKSPVSNFHLQNSTEERISEGEEEDDCCHEDHGTSHQRDDSARSLIDSDSIETLRNINENDQRVYNLNYAQNSFKFSSKVQNAVKSTSATPKRNSAKSSPRNRIKTTKFSPRNNKNLSPDESTRTQEFADGNEHLNFNDDARDPCIPDIHTTDMNSYAQNTLNDRRNLLNDININLGTQIEIILPESLELAPDNASNCQTPMETDGETTVISQTSSLTEFSKDSDLDDKSTGTLLREALEFKKALLMQIERENQLNEGIQLETESNKYDLDEASKLKNDNHFQSKLLDSISEEHSASSSTERTSKTYVLRESSIDKKSRDSLPKTPNSTTVNVKDQSSGGMNLEYESCSGSKTQSASTSTEYFSAKNTTDNDPGVERKTVDRKRELIEMKIQNRDHASASIIGGTSQKNSDNFEKPGIKIEVQEEFEKDLIDWTSKMELQEEMKSPECRASGTDAKELKRALDNSKKSITEKQVRWDTDTISSSDTEKDTRNDGLSSNSIQTSYPHNRKGMPQLRQESVLNLNNSAQNFLVDDHLALEQQQREVNTNYNESNRLKNIDELDDTVTYAQGIESVNDASEVLRSNSTEEMQEQVRNINDLVLESVRNIRTYAQIFSQSQNDAILDTRKAILHQRQLLNNGNVEDDWSLNLLEPRSQVPWNPMTESSSDESIKRFINALNNHDPKNIETIARQKLMMLSSTDIEGRNFATAGESFKHNSNLCLKRRPGAFSLADDADINREVLGTVEDSDTMIESMSETKESGDNDSDISSIFMPHGNTKYGSNKLQRKQIFTKLKTLDAFTKPLEISESCTDMAENGGEGSPLTSRTVVCMPNHLVKGEEDISKGHIENRNDITERNDINSNAIIPSLSNGRIRLGEANASPMQTNDETNTIDGNGNTNVACSIEVQGKSTEVLNSSLKSRSGSLYFTDDASVSNATLNIIRDVESSRSLGENNAETNAGTKTTVLDNTAALTKVTSTPFIGSKPQEGKLKVKSRINTTSSCMSIMGVSEVDIKPFDFNKNLSVECMDSNLHDDTSNSCIDNRSVSKHEISRCKIISSDAKTTSPLTEKKSTSSRTNLSSDPSESYVDVTNIEFGVSSVTLTSDNSTLATNLTRTKHLRPNSIYSSNNTSSTYVDASNQFFETSSNIGSTLDGSFFDTRSKVIERSAVYGSKLRTNNLIPCVKLNEDKFDAHGTASLLRKQPTTGVKRIKNSASSLDNALMANGKPGPRIPSREMTVQSNLSSNQGSAKRSKLIPKFSLNSPTTSRKSQISAPTTQLSAKSSITLTQGRWQSHVAARKNQLSTQSSGNLDRLYSMRDVDIDRNESKVIIPSSRAKPVSRASSRSCIPILKTRMPKQTEFQGRSKSPVRGPLTISSPGRDFSHPKYTVHDFNDNFIETSQSAPFERRRSEILRSITCDHKQEGRKGETIENPSEELRKAHETTDLLEKTDPGPVPKECTVIYVNKSSDNDPSETHVAGPKDLMEYIPKVRLRSDNIGPVVTNTTSAPAATTQDTDAQPVAASIFSSGTEIENSNITSPSNNNGLSSTHATLSKMLSTNTLYGSQFFRVEQKEIEVSAKPSVINTSTSVSDLPGVSAGDNRKLERPTFDGPKGLTEEEHIMLLEAFEKDPNYFEGRRTHKLYNKLGLGFREEPEHS